jgi:hypothetical protein
VSNTALVSFEVSPEHYTVIKAIALSRHATISNFLRQTVQVIPIWRAGSVGWWIRTTGTRRRSCLRLTNRPAVGIPAMTAGMSRRGPRAWTCGRR